MHHLIAALVLAQAVASPSPAPTPTPNPGAVTLSGVLGAYAVTTKGAPATLDLSSAMLTIAKPNGTFRFSATVGAYAFPVVGAPFAYATDPGANTSLFSWVPSAYIAWAPDAHWTISAGKQATLLGQESNFTYQNADIQRGLGWNAEPSFSRGVRAAYTSDAFTGALEINDGYYSGRYRAVEGLVGWAPSSATDLLFAFIVPDRDTPANPTASIANKAEYDFMLTQSFGKLTLAPYYLVIASPASASAGFTSAESASLGSMIATWQFSPALSLAGRYERFVDHSAAGDPSANADLLGYGAGSSAASWTFTPQYNFGRYFVRLEGSRVDATGFSQSRALVEAGVKI
ncbi:MAG TPA: outer membrane beta-barrel protein [Candidatus Baltobacteraceae bacterium]|jgi:hypothetical protein